MANGNSTVKIEILGDASGATKALQDVSTAAEKASSDLDKSLPKGDDNPIKKMAKDSEEGGGLLKTAVGTAIGVFTGAELPGVMAKFKEAFGGFADTASEVGDAVFKLDQETGMSAENSSALLSVFERMGVSGDDASKSLGNLSKQIEGSSLTAKGLTGGLSASSDRLKQLGIDVLDASGNTRPMNDILMEVADRFKDMPDGAEKTAIAMQLFGKAGKDMIPVLDEGGDGMKDLMAEATKMGLTLSGDNVNQIRAYSMAQKDMGEALAGVRLQIGTALIPIMLKATEAVSAGAKAFNADILPAIKIFAAYVSASVIPVLEQWYIWFQTKILPVLTLIGAWFVGVGINAVKNFYAQIVSASTFIKSHSAALDALKAVLVGLGTAFAVWALYQGYLKAAEIATKAFAAAQAALDAVMDANPVMLVVLAIAALAAGVYELIQHWDAITAKVPALGVAWNALTDWVTSTLLPLLKQIGTDLLAAWEDVEPKVIAALGVIKDAITAVFGAIVGFIRDHGEQIKTILKAAWDVIGGTITNAITVIKDTIKLVMDLIHGNWSGVWNDLKGIVGTVFTEIGTIVHDELTVITTVLSGAWDAIKGKAADLWGEIETAITAPIKAVADFLSPVWDAISNVAQTAWHILSTIATAEWTVISTIIETVVKAIAKLLELEWDGMRDTAKAVWQALSDVVLPIVHGIHDVITTVVGAIRDFIAPIWDAISTKASDVWDALKSALTTTLGLIKDAITTPINDAKIGLSTIWDTITSDAGKAWDALKAKFDGAKQGIKDTLLWPFTEMRDALSGIMGTAESNAKGPINAVIGGLNTVGDAVAGALRFIGDKLDVGNLKGINFPHLPAFASGVQNFSGGYAIVGEKGPEIVKLPKGADVIPNAETIGLMKGQQMGFKGLGSGPLDLGKSLVNGAKDAISTVYESVSAIAAKGADWILSQAFKLDKLPMPGDFGGLGSGILSTAKDGLLQLIKGALSGITSIGGTLPGNANFPGGNAVLDMARQTAGVYMWCEKFVGDVMQRLGLRYHRAGTAEEHSQMQPLQPGTGPAGAVVFLPWGDLGHVAFSMGDGKHIYGTANTATGTGVIDAWGGAGWTVNPAANGAYVKKPTLLLSGEGGDREGEITSPVQMMRKVMQEELQASSLKAPQITQHITGMMPGQVTIETKKALRSMVLERRIA